MKKLVSISLLFLCVSCNLYQPIAHIDRYYPPTNQVTILPEPPTNYGSYFGTLKVVPRDYSVPNKKDLQRALENIKIEATKYGAIYIYIRNYDPRTSDFTHLRFLDVSYGDGAILEAELYR